MEKYAWRTNYDYSLHINNEALDHELFANDEYNEIFCHQRHHNLRAVINNVEKMGGDNILLLIDIDDITKVLQHLAYIDSNRLFELSPLFWNNIISFIFMKQLTQKYGIQTDHNLDEEEDYITNGSDKEYFYVQELLVNRDDVFEAIKQLNMANCRVHIVLRWYSGFDVWNELSHYFDSKLPFITMLYTDGSMNANSSFENLYTYKLFPQYGEGKLYEPPKSHRSKSRKSKNNGDKKSSN